MSRSKSPLYSAINKIKKYIDSCPTKVMKESAINDFSNTISDYKNIGYSWGQKSHLIPIDISKFSTEDLEKISFAIQKIHKSNIQGF